MIKYNLTCKCNCTFDSWFASSGEFGRLMKKKLITCIECNSNNVSKSIMAPNVSSSKKIAFSVANSPLVKTAVAGADPNYGRIIMAIGQSKENIALNNLTIRFGKFIVVENGKQIHNYNEKIVKEYMNWNAIEINIELNMGKSNFTVYTCDFTKDYIDINADYRN